MKQVRLRCILGLQIFFSTPNLQAQNIGINADGSMSDSSAMLDIKAAMGNKQNELRLFCSQHAELFSFSHI
jgi:hypothetical protein